MSAKALGIAGLSLRTTRGLFQQSKLYNPMTTQLTIATDRSAFVSPLLNRKGDSVGIHASFIGRRSASEVRALLAKKWPDLKSNALSAKVREVMRGRSTLSEQLMLASIVELRSEAEKNGKAVVWQGMKANFKTGNVSLSAKVINPDKKVETPVAAKPAPSIDEAIDSMTEEQAMALVAKISAKFGA